MLLQETNPYCKRKPPTRSVLRDELHSHAALLVLQAKAAVANDQLQDLSDASPNRRAKGVEGVQKYS